MPLRQEPNPVPEKAACCVRKPGYNEQNIYIKIGEKIFIPRLF